MSSFPYQATLYIPTLTEWVQFSEALADIITPGDIVGMDGPLGIGKTTCIQAMAKRWGITEAVNSPSFGLIHEYDASDRHLVHVDLYRLGPEQASRLAPEIDGLISDPRTTLIAEWAEYGSYLKPLINWSLRFDWSSRQENERQVLLASIKPLPKNLFQWEAPGER